MSLDIYLYYPHGEKSVNTEPRIYIREDGQTKEISRAEWDARFPDREPVTITPGEEPDHYVFSANITHNLNHMADAVGLHGPVWQPETNGVQFAWQLIGPLQVGIAKLESDPDCYRQYEPDNKWGTYDGFVPWLRRLLDACERHPNAWIEISR